MKWCVQVCPKDKNNDKQVSTLNTLDKLKDENKDFKFEKGILDNIVE